MSTRVLCVIGTRPEAVKMAPLVRALEADARFDARLCVTAQHREMLDPMLALFGLRADCDLAVMQAGQDLADVTARVLLGLRDVLRADRPALVLVHGDTTTCLAAGLAAFYEQIPVGHVEAGLRSGDLAAPFPEELNRVAVDALARFCFAPTETARANLLAQGIAPERIHVTGNTVIDALLAMRAQVRRERPAALEQALGAERRARVEAWPGRVVLVTCHRRESFGAGLERVLGALAGLARAHEDWLFLYPVHLNPAVRNLAYQRLAGLANALLFEPVDYAAFVWLMARADLIVSDSGGVQEEGPALGKPVVCLRERTERPEAVAAGGVRLVGTDGARIVAALEEILGDAAVYARMAGAPNPYGDGRAAERIVAALAAHFCPRALSAAA